MLFDWWLLLTGFGIGLIMSSPAGPVNFLCFHRTLHRGLFAGWMIALGAIAADTIFASAAIFGIKAASEFIAYHIGILQLIGGLLIIIFGLYLLLHKVTDVQPGKGKQKIWRYFFTGFGLSITNPGNFFGFMAMFSGVTDLVTESASLFHGTSLILGVVLGALTWWLALTTVTHKYRSKMTLNALLRINKVAGTVILAAGGVFILRYFMGSGSFAF